MGVTQLWNILQPVKQQGDLASLKGKTLCVDLSGWICEAQGSKGLQANVLKPHLRNLFFRVWNLTRVGVKLVFVVDGDAPEVKWEAIARRNEARHGNGGRGRGKAAGRGQRKKAGRSNFRVWVDECTTLLTLLGIPYVESAGEAEALCAWMDAKGIVDGCITNDGDAFLYGARTVYKDLCVSNKECTMDYYCMDDIEAKIGLDRDTLVSLAVLLGCDYLPQGVPGVGKEMGLKLVQALRGVNLLQRLQDWSNFEVSDADMSKIEKSIKQKALKVAGFPNKEVINEFMSPKLKTQHLTVTKGYKCPDVKRLLEFCCNYLEWPEDYTKEKILPLVTYWQMETKLPSNHYKQGNVVTPERIVKARVQNRIECYEVTWQSDHIGDGCSFTFVTIETRTLFGQVYPVLVEEFEALQEEKKNKKLGKKKSKKHPEHLPISNENAVEDLCINLDTLSLSETSPPLANTISQTDLYGRGREIPLSEDEATYTSSQDTQPGNALPDCEHMLQGLQENRKIQQRQEEDLEKHVRNNKLAPNESKVPTGTRNSKCKEKFKLKDERVEQLLESDSSSEDEMSNSFYCEFVAPLSQRIQGHCSTKKCHDSDAISLNRSRKPDAAIKNSAHEDSEAITNFKDGNVHEVLDTAEKFILIESSEDEAENDGGDRSPSKETIPTKEQNNVIGRTTLEDSSLRGSGAKTSQDGRSDVEMTAIDRSKLRTRIKNSHKPLEKIKTDVVLNVEEIDVLGEMSLGEVVKQVVDNQLQTLGEVNFMDDSGLNIIEINTESVNSIKRGASGPCEKATSRNGADSSSIFLRDDGARATMASQIEEIQSTEIQLRCGENFRSNPKPKVMQRVYFSSESSDEDDSWYFSPDVGVRTNFNKNIKKVEKKDSKLTTSNFVDTKPCLLDNEDIRLEKHPNSSCAVTHDGLDCCSNKAEKGSTHAKSKAMEKTKEHKENIESPFEEFFVPLSLSERLGKQLNGRRNVLSTLRTLSSN